MGAQLAVGDLWSSRKDKAAKEAKWVFEQFAQPPKERSVLLNCVHQLSASDTVGNHDEVAQMPRTLDERNLSRRWWPKQSTFCLFTMQGASMSYHLDLWATAVLYVVLWGVKLFVVAPPTKHNLGLLRSWQESGGDGRREAHARFPAELEQAQIAVLLQHQALLLPSGWVHAVFTPVDSSTLGWNWQPEAQLPSALECIRSSWGPQAHRYAMLC